MRILVVEDDRLLGDAIQVGLVQAGFAVDWVRDGMAAMASLAADPNFAAVVLDLGLPKVGGLEVLRKMRSRGDRTPVLILTARDTVPDRIGGLDAGADDYLVKPFDMGELAARLRAIARRSTGNPAPLLRAAEVEIDPAARTVRFRDRDVELSAREFSVLEALVRSAGRVLTRAQIESALYAWGEEVESNAVEVHIHHLRRKLDPTVIRTMRGVGYLVARDG